jgi:putative transposase
MPRALREDYRGAVHHVFVRGVGRAATALDDSDHDHALFLLERVAEAFELDCHAWCYLPNHFHLLVTSRLGNLSRAMHWLGTCTAQSFNQRHERSGHLYQGRFGSRLVEDDTHLLELARYLPLNPVRAHLCARPEDWPWSSYAATVGHRPAPWFLNPGVFLDLFRSAAEYTHWVAQGVDAAALDADGSPIPKPRSPSLESLLAADDSDVGIQRAHVEHGISQRAIARHLNVDPSTINRRLARLRDDPRHFERRGHVGK